MLPFAGVRTESQGVPKKNQTRSSSLRIPIPIPKLPKSICVCVVKISEPRLKSCLFISPFSLQYEAKDYDGIIKDLFKITNDEGVVLFNVSVPALGLSIDL